MSISNDPTWSVTTRIAQRSRERKSRARHRRARPALDPPAASRSPQRFAQPAGDVAGRQDESTIGDDSRTVRHISGMTSRKFRAILTRHVGGLGPLAPGSGRVVRRLWAASCDARPIDRDLPAVSRRAGGVRGRPIARRRAGDNLARDRERRAGLFVRRAADGRKARLPRMWIAKPGPHRRIRGAASGEPPAGENRRCAAWVPDAFRLATPAISSGGMLARPGALASRMGAHAGEESRTARWHRCQPDAS
jgi:hypothetical protein